MVTKRSGSAMLRSSRVSRYFASVEKSRAQAPEGEHAVTNRSSHSLLTSNSQRTTNIDVLSPAPGRTQLCNKTSGIGCALRPSVAIRTTYGELKFVVLVRSVTDSLNGGVRSTSKS